MNFIESELVELRSEVVSDLCKEVIAFANTKGGRLYIGVGDDGQIVGVENTDRVTLQLNNMVRDFIKPDVTMFVRYETQATANRILKRMVADGLLCQEGCGRKTRYRVK